MYSSPAVGVSTVEQVFIGAHVFRQLCRIEDRQTGVDVARQSVVFAFELVENLRHQVRRPTDNKRLDAYAKITFNKRV